MICSTGYAFFQLLVTNRASNVTLFQILLGYFCQTQVFTVFWGAKDGFYLSSKNYLRKATSSIKQHRFEKYYEDWSLQAADKSSKARTNE